MTTLRKAKDISKAPGCEIQHLLDERGVSQGEFAEVIGYSEKQLSRILTGAVPLSMDFAMRLEWALGENAADWLRKETEYRLALEKGKKESEQDNIRIRQEIYEKMPVREMVKLGWLAETKRDTEKLVAAVKAFWKIDSRTPLDFSFLDASPAMLMRSSEAYQGRFNPSYAATWLWQARREAEKRVAELPLPSCDFDSVRAAACGIPACSIRDDGEDYFLARLRSLGVLAFELPHLPKTYLDGAAFLQGTTPVVVFTRRLNRVDNFWFVLAHELAHVCLHLKPGSCPERVFVDCEEPARGDAENEANALASAFLGHAAIRRHFLACPRITRERILEYARSVPVHPGIVVGFLQHIRFLTYYNFNDLKSRDNGGAVGQTTFPKHAHHPRAERRPRRTPV